MSTSYLREDRQKVEEAVKRATLLFAVSGLLALLSSYLPMRPGADAAMLRMLGLGDLAIALFIRTLPWRRWGGKPLLILAPLAFATITLFTLAGAQTPYTYSTFYVITFIWVGLSLPPRTSLVLAPLAAFTYVLPLVVAGTAERTAHSVAVVIPISVLVGELISQTVTHLYVAHHGMGRLLSATKALGTATDTVQATDLVAGLALELLEGDTVVVFVTREPGSAILVASGQRNLPSLLGEMVIDTSAETSGAGLAIKRSETVFIPGGDALAAVHPRLRELADAQAGVFFPLPGEDGHVGAISVLWRAPHRRLEPFARQAIELLSVEAGRVLERLRATERLAEEAQTDPLTGLLNRRSFTHVLAAAAPGDVLVLLDLDEFKRVNDTHGHAAGDETLRRFADSIRSASRQLDKAARLGGDEFAISLAQAGPEGASAAAARLRRSWRATKPLSTFSAGSAALREGEDWQSLLERADAALYRAKAMGRDRDEVANGPADATSEKMPVRKQLDSGGQEYVFS